MATTATRRRGELTADRAARLRAEAERLTAEAEAVEAAALLAERMADAGRVPTCPECGGRTFKVYAWTQVAQSIAFPEEAPADADPADLGGCDDYESGDHTDQNASATCADCGADAEEVLGAHGWTFYGDPAPLDAGVPPVKEGDGEPRA